MNTRINQKAFAMPMLLITITFLTLSLTYFLTQIMTSLSLAYGEQYRLNAQLAADAGLDVGLMELSADSAWTGTTGEITLLNTSNLRTTYEVQIADVGLNRKSIRSVGKTYSPSSASTARNTRIFEVEVEGITASSTSIVVGVGGLVLNNSAKIVDGAVFVNGEISMSGTAQIGTNTNPLPVYVANQVCPIPADASFPQLCSSGENNNPVSINSPNSYIYGQVNANYQTDATNIINPDDPANPIGLSSGVPAQDLPTHDREALKAATAGNEITGTAASCTTNNGTRTWGPNQKIVGNVTVSRRCTVTIEGDVWIDGSLTMLNQGEIIVSETPAGGERPVIMIDGEDGLQMNQSSTFVQNSSGQNVEVITYWSNASCSPDCTDVTGSDLASSQNTPTIDIVNSGGAAEAIFYARWSKVIIRNSVNVGALVGQVVELEQSATIAFSSPLPGFTPVTTWVQRGYLRVFQ